MNAPKATARFPGSPPPEPGSRFVVSHRTAPFQDDDQRKLARERFDGFVDQALAPNATLKRQKEAPEDHGRRILVLEMDDDELREKLKDAPDHLLVERELPRQIPRPLPPPLRDLHRRARPEPAARTAVEKKAQLSLTLTVLADGVPAEGAQVGIWFETGGGNTTLVQTVTDAQGQAALAYTPGWTASKGLILPYGRAWSMMVEAPQNGQTINLPPLPMGQGPIGWWHALTGARYYDPNRGAGIRIGVVDTGAGPTPLLNHVHGLGAFLFGEFLPGPQAAEDVQDHGTAVTGLLGARPLPGSTDFCGLVPGADIGVVRVYGETGGASQVDIASAIDLLSINHRADLINLSLGGAASAIEHDAITAARLRGTLCLASAGNAEGGAVTYPAAYPECVAVSALGLLGTTPAGSFAASWTPDQWDRYSVGGVFVPDFISVGWQIDAIAPGTGLISTIPSRYGLERPYADMSGTSLAAPLTTGVLAALLSRDPLYHNLPRTALRADYARQVLAQHLVNLGVAPWYQGCGAAYAFPMI
ncbi:S8 family serine peptidase [Niveispirillum sp. SYP-B3756]|uniref:S8 family serine peptidase n=1 Tax=Niveispirillum sp. SYP-B3756 TaxID=2662178 RepID=UPI001291741F|nr:S8 family serine peptidase [Niveispirillum sp. SYP-B3756]MQP68427.1 S8 family serine peptidase [Niveispirillum sp. SYP-B3756]